MWFVKHGKEDSCYFQGANINWPSGLPTKNENAFEDMNALEFPKKEKAGERNISLFYCLKNQICFFLS